MRFLSLLFLIFIDRSGGQSSSTTNGTAAGVGGCQNLGPSELTQKLRDTGKFNEKYMAATLDDAARYFPDLSDRHFVRSTQRYVCDASCQEKTENVKRLLNSKGQPVDWPRLNVVPTTLAPPPAANPQPTPGVVPGPAAIAADPAIAGRRKRRDAVKANIKLENIGQSYILYCSPEGFEDVAGYHKLCSGCRSVRELPDDYFPRFLNEVRCSGTKCVKEHGNCVQKYLNFDILRNEGSRDCQRWVPYTANVPVCCDCLLSSQSTIFLTLVQKES